jgi:hypothetical protein
MRMQDSHKHKHNATAVPTSDTPKQTNDTAGNAEQTTPRTDDSTEKKPNTPSEQPGTLMKTPEQTQQTPATGETAATPAKQTESTGTNTNSTPNSDTPEVKTEATTAGAHTSSENTPASTGGNTPATPATTPAVVDSGVVEGSNRPLLAFIAGVLVAVLGWYAYSNLIAASDDDTLQYADPIAVVDGEAVDRDLFVQNLTETLTSLEAQGLDIADESIRTSYETQVLDTLINTRLLVAAAEEAGYQPTEEEIRTRISELETQFGDAAALDAQLSELGLDRESLYTDVSEQLSVDALLTAEVLGDNLTVTDAELQEAYDVLIEAGRELPELDTIRDALSAQIEQQKQQQLINTYLNQLRDEAEIEINL